MTTLLATIFVFGLIVFIHEFGHFITAKASGMRVDEFAIGFGPAIFRKKKGETLYSIRIIPLGGYNKIAGMTEDEELDDASFLSKPVWKRFIVIAAGAVFNFLLAIVLFFGLFLAIGKQEPSNLPIIGSIQSNSPAQIAHLQENDVITSIGGKQINTWVDISTSLQGQSQKAIPLTFTRNGEVHETMVIPKDINGRSIIGITEKMDYTSYSIDQAAIKSVTYTGSIIVDMVTGLWHMIIGTEEAALSGPVGVAKTAGDIASVSFISLLYFVAILSLNLGVINLLPLPVLDGGHLIFLLIEGITGKKLPAKILQYIQMAGVVFLLLVFIYATASDLSRLFK